MRREKLRKRRKVIKEIVAREAVAHVTDDEMLIPEDLFNSGLMGA